MRYRSLQIQGPITYEQAEFINQFRVLMSQMAYLLRFYTVERLSGLTDGTAVLEKFLEIPRKLNELVATIPGIEVDFVPVVLSYLGGLQDLVDAMIDGDDAKADQVIRELYVISDRNVAYLAELSPYWEEERWRNLFYTFIKDLVAEVLALESGDFQKSLDIFASRMEKTYQRADYYAQGFIPFLTGDQTQIPPAYFNMIQDFRKIHTEWAYLTRFYMASKIIGLGGPEYPEIIKSRMYALPTRMAEKFKLILGEEAANELLNLLSVYIVRLEGIVNAVASGDEAEAEAQTAQAYNFASQFANKLAVINPYWDENEAKELFFSLAELIVQEAYNLQTEDYVTAMQTFTEIMYTSLAIADFFSAGLYQYTLIGAEQATESETEV